MMPLLAAMGPEKGIPYLMEAMNKSRDMKQDAGGFWRYTDTRERVFPDAVKAGPQPTDVQRNLEAAGYEPGTDEFRQALRAHRTKPLSRPDVRLPPQHKETAETSAERRVGKKGVDTLRHR